MKTKNEPLRGAAAPAPLDDDVLSQVAGGRAQSELHFVKVIDKASPDLFRACASGSHLPEATIS